MTPFQSFMILKTNKQDATKSYSEVCWAGSALGLWGPGSPFSKPPVFKPTEAQRHLSPSPQRPGRSGAGAAEGTFSLAQPPGPGRRSTTSPPRSTMSPPGCGSGAGPGAVPARQVPPPAVTVGLSPPLPRQGSVPRRGGPGWGRPSSSAPCSAAGAAAEGARGARCHGGPVQPQEPG